MHNSLPLTPQVHEKHLLSVLTTHRGLSYVANPIDDFQTLCLCRGHSRWQQGCSETCHPRWTSAHSDTQTGQIISNSLHRTSVIISQILNCEAAVGVFAANMGCRDFVSPFACRSFLLSFQYVVTRPHKGGGRFCWRFGASGCCRERTFEQTLPFGSKHQVPALLRGYWLERDVVTGRLGWCLGQGITSIS